MLHMLQIGFHELVLQSTRITWVNIHMQLCIYIYIYMHTHVRIYVHSCLHLYTRMYGHRHRHKFSLNSDVAHCWFDGQCLTKRTDLVSRLGSPLLPLFFPCACTTEPIIHNTGTSFQTHCIKHTSWSRTKHMDMNFIPLLQQIFVCINMVETRGLVMVG